ncbi:putative 149 kDa protein [Symbiodinium microadriaticum]|uniref:Putative 149 kDa protein n=1 Tax=Symbiodinium microadriaticum TaxID=2951 RepID=A0A1Q9C2E3_SYMMI|nr:putative 149 kDa protein [Symbiodinium microadriaticum]
MLQDVGTGSLALPVPLYVASPMPGSDTIHRSCRYHWGAALAVAMMLLTWLEVLFDGSIWVPLSAISGVLLAALCFRQFCAMPDVATLMLQRSPQQGQAFKELVQYRLQAVRDADHINHILLSSWQIVFGSQKLASTAHTVFARWRHAVKYRSIRKQLHAQAVVAKRARLQQQLQDAESASHSRNPGMLYQVLRSIAPKIRRRRMQLRDADHKLAGPDKEPTLVMQHFADVFAAKQATTGFTLREAFPFTAEEFTQCLHELPAHKALPAHCAPAPLWKWCCEAVGAATTKCLGGCFQPGSFAEQWPEDWSVSYLCLLPKTDQQLDEVNKMRPISLLNPLGKSFAGMFMCRIRADVTKAVAPFPQFAYLTGRSTMDAIDRAMLHMWQTQNRTGRQYTLHHRRAGVKQQALLGSVTLSVDLSKAFDSIARDHIRSSLEWAGIPGAVVDVILGMHHAMTLQYSTSSHSARTATGKGVRQGCRLAPILWSCFTGWLMSKLVPVLSNSDLHYLLTLFADDTLCQWEVNDVEQVHQALLVRAGVDCPLYTLASQTVERHRITAAQEVFKVQPPALTELWNQVLASIRPSDKGQDTSPTQLQREIPHAALTQESHSASTPLPVTASLPDEATAPVCPKLHGVTQSAKAPVPQPAIPSASDVSCVPLRDRPETLHSLKQGGWRELARFHMTTKTPLMEFEEVFTDAFQGANKRSSQGPLEERPAQQPKGKGRGKHDDRGHQMRGRHRGFQPLGARVSTEDQGFESFGSSLGYMTQDWQPQSAPWRTNYQNYQVQELQQQVDQMSRLLHRHELEIMHLRVDSGFVLHLGAGTRGIIRTLVAASAEYANKKMKEPRMNLTLKQTMLLTVFRTLKDRLAKLEETPDLLAHVRKLGWHHPTDNQWLHLRWSQEKEQLIPEEPQRMFPHAALNGHLDSILEILEEDKVLHQFNATRRFNDQTDTTVMFFIRVSLQGQKAQLLFQRLLALCGLGCLQMIDATLRRERLEPQPLAKQIRNLSDRRNRY